MQPASCQGGGIGQPKSLVPDQPVNARKLHLNSVEFAFVYKSFFIGEWYQSCSNRDQKMIGRLKDMIRSERSLPEDIRHSLVDGLFYPFASFIAGALAGVWIAATVTYAVEDFWIRALADFVVLSAIARMVIGFRYITLNRSVGQNEIRVWERLYALGAAMFAGSLGILCFCILLLTDHKDLQLMLCTTTAGYAASITGRNAGRPWVAISQLYLASFPMCLGLILHPGTFYQVMGFTIFLFMFGMTDITVSVRKTIVGALETRAENAELAKSFRDQASLFDDALNNMSHGLCMFDISGKLLVWNHKLAGIMGCRESVFHEGMTLEDMINALKKTAGSKAKAKALEDMLTRSFREQHTPQSFLRLSDSKVVSISRQVMDNGHVVIVFEDVTEQTKAHERIEQLAWTDHLTGLMNRASFHELLKNALAVLDDEGQTVALHLIDLDNFKTVNDTLGHSTGDLLLIEVARRIEKACDREEHVARLGGDEFVIIQKLSESSQPPEILAQRVLQTLSAPYNIVSNRINIGASIGIAIAGSNMQEGDVLLKRADMALYRAKEDGRNCYQFFEEEMDLLAQQRRQLELDIRTAVQEGQFVLNFQPIVNAETHEISAFETLIRWPHATRGFVSPAEFIPVAEETGLIIEIGRWVLEEAVRQASTWPGNVAIAVNFSAAQFHDEQFPIFVLATLNKYGLSPTRLELEITETALLQTSVPTIEMLEQFKSLGIRISLDDFGTGYSSLSQLRTFPFNKIKIDGSFVRDLGKNASSVAVIRAVTNIGKILDMTVVAECVETEDQLQFLKNAGVNEIQGYLFGRPRPAAEVLDLFTSSGAPMKLIANG